MNKPKSWTSMKASAIKLVEAAWVELADEPEILQRWLESSFRFQYGLRFVVEGKKDKTALEKLKDRVIRQIELWDVREAAFFILAFPETVPARLRNTRLRAWQDEAMEWQIDRDTPLEPRERKRVSLHVTKW